MSTFFHFNILSQKIKKKFLETNTEINSLNRLPDCVIAKLIKPNDTTIFEFKYSQLSSFDANKYLEDVRNGIYPLTAFGLDKQLKNTTILPPSQLQQQQQQQHHHQAQLNNNNNNNNNQTAHEQQQTWVKIRILMFFF